MISLKFKDDVFPPFRAGVVPKTTFIAPTVSEKLKKEYESHREKAACNIKTLLDLEKKARVYREEDKSYEFYHKLSTIAKDREERVQQSKFSHSRIPLQKVFKVNEL